MNQAEGRLNNEQYYRRLSREMQVPYLTLLNFLSHDENVRFSREEIEQLMPLKGANHLIGRTTKEQIIEQVSTPDDEKPLPWTKNPRFKTLEQFRAEYPNIKHVLWGDDDGLWYLGCEDLEKKDGEKIDIPLSDINTRFNRKENYPGHLTIKYWSVKPVYRPLNFTEFFNIYAMSLLSHLPSEFPAFKDRLVWLGDEYTKRMTEQARAEAMEMEAVNYRFSRLHDRASQFIQGERLKKLQDNIDHDEPFMYSEFSPEELYVYYTLHTDTLFCFFQPVWQKFSDAMRETLVIKKFVNKPDFENARRALIAMDRIHQMTHTTDASFLVDTYTGMKALPEGVYTVFPPNVPSLEQIATIQSFPAREMGFSPRTAGTGYLGVISDWATNEWLAVCDDTLAERVRSVHPEEMLKTVPLPTSKKITDLEFGYNFVNLHKLHQRQVEERLLH